jgi:hypothetical protein
MLHTWMLRPTTDARILWWWCAYNTGGGANYNIGGKNSNTVRNYNGGGGGGSSDSGSGGNNPNPSPPPPRMRFENWNYCHTHGGDINNNHTIATCAHSGEHHQRTATRTNTMGGNIKGMQKTMLPSSVGRCPPAAHSPLPPVNYMPIFFHPFSNNGLRLPMTPGSWDFHSSAPIIFLCPSKEWG